MHDAHDPEEIAQWHRWFAIECNNRAWALADSRMRTAADTEEMIQSAHAAALHWNACGNELNRARASMLLGHALALAGEGARARQHAQTAYDYIMSHESREWEIAFAHAVLANAAAANGDRDLHARQYAEADRIGAKLAEDDRVVFERALRGVPVPTATVPR